uniref:Uncharacterized protein n=1 Tax=Anguilla anguilla TaxID=7936 RepID=A0A0E9RBM4_ANGAN
MLLTAREKWKGQAAYVTIELVDYNKLALQLHVLFL